MQPTAIDWSVVDWTHNDKYIVRKYGVSHSRVPIMRKKFGRRRSKFYKMHNAGIRILLKSVNTRGMTIKQLMEEYGAVYHTVHAALKALGKSYKKAEKVIPRVNGSYRGIRYNVDPRKDTGAVDELVDQLGLVS